MSTEKTEVKIHPPATSGARLTKRHVCVKSSDPEHVEMVYNNLMAECYDIEHVVACGEGVLIIGVLNHERLRAKTSV